MGWILIVGAGYKGRGYSRHRDLAWTKARRWESTGYRPSDPHLSFHLSRLECRAPGGSGGLAEVWVTDTIGFSSSTSWEFLVLLFNYIYIMEDF